MADVLFLPHRLPYPPNKGDKVRSYHLLRSLAKRHRVFLGTFVDDPDDERHIDTVRSICADLFVGKIDPRWAKLRSLSGMLRGEALTVAYYRDEALARWVRRVVEEEGVRDAVVFSSAMAQYVLPIPSVRILLDCVDVDSAKWTQYAATHRWPVSALYRREGRRLLAFEARAVDRSAAAYFVTDAEAELFKRLAPASGGKVATVSNGVDAEYFSPQHGFPTPFGANEIPVVFTGAMDYWPNIDAAQWFVAEVLPRLEQLWPQVVFHIVGMRPTSAVRALAGAKVDVTGTVPDVRPYLAHAAVAVAPLRIARGVQNKVLEAMAMARPVVASTACSAGIDARAGREFEAAADASGFVAAIDALLRSPDHGAAMGHAARARVCERYSWDANLARIATAVAPGSAPPARTMAPVIGKMSHARP